MTHSQVRDSVFVQAQEGVLAGRRRAQATQLKQERSKLVVNMQTYADSQQDRPIAIPFGIADFLVSVPRCTINTSIGRCYQW